MFKFNVGCIFSGLKFICIYVSEKYKEKYIFWSMSLVFDDELILIFNGFTYLKLIIA